MVQSCSTYTAFTFTALGRNKSCAACLIYNTAHFVSVSLGTIKIHFHLSVTFLYLSEIVLPNLLKHVSFIV